jgi:hypothetical protein
VNALANLDKALAALAKAQTLPEVKKIRDVAEAARVYAKVAHMSKEALDYAANIKLLAERKAGEILAKLDKSSGGRPSKTADTASGVSEYRQALADSNTGERMSERWQELAAIPEEDVENYLAQSKQLDKPASATGALQHYRKTQGAAPISADLPVALKQQKSPADFTAILTALLSEMTALNALTAKLKSVILDKPSQDQVETLIECLRKISTDAAQRADRLASAILRGSSGR